MHVRNTHVVFSCGFHFSLDLIYKVCALTIHRHLNLSIKFHVKLFSSSEIILLMMNKHVFLRLLVFFVLTSMPTMCTPYCQSRLNLVSEICLVNILTFSARGVTVIF